MGMTCRGVPAGTDVGSTADANAKACGRNLPESTSRLGLSKSESPPTHERTIRSATKSRRDASSYITRFILCH